jgi:hypothetical protein
VTGADTGVDEGAAGLGVVACASLCLAEKASGVGFAGAGLLDLAGGGVSVGLVVPAGAGLLPSGFAGLAGVVVSGSAWLGISLLGVSFAGCFAGLGGKEVGFVAGAVFAANFPLE